MSNFTIAMLILTGLLMVGFIGALVSYAIAKDNERAQEISSIIPPFIIIILISLVLTTCGITAQ